MEYADVILKNSLKEILLRVTKKNIYADIKNILKEYADVSLKNSFKKILFTK
jgi:hypothetical protein